LLQQLQYNGTKKHNQGKTPIFADFCKNNGSILVSRSQTLYPTATRGKGLFQCMTSNSVIKRHFYGIHAFSRFLLPAQVVEALCVISYARLA